MQISFTDSIPAQTRLAAYIVNKDALPGDLENAVKEGAQAARFKGGAGQTFESFVERDGKVVRIALAGAGKADAKDRAANLEKAGAALAAKYTASGEKSLALDLSGSGLSASDAAAVLMGLRLRNWRYDQYRTTQKDEQKRTLEAVQVVGAPDGTQDAWTDRDALAAGVEFTRELVTEPANVIYPESFVERCQERFEGTGAELVVLDEAQMGDLGMGALLGVGQGSVRESRILAIKRGAKANVVGVVGLVENMPDGNAQRPGDVVTSMNGQTIEVINTDAEGRLVLCDALHWAQEEFKPKRIVDFATLTGAIIISLGHEHAGVFSNDDELADDLAKASKASGDATWRLPIGPAYDKLIDSPIADMKNVGPRGAGSITAAQFLKRFIKDDVAWAHVDIAGMVWADKPGATWGKGATGFGVRLIDQYVRDQLED
mgnify:CR=1 FL=1